MKIDKVKNNIRHDFIRRFNKCKSLEDLTVNELYILIDILVEIIEGYQDN